MHLYIYIWDNWAKYYNISHIIPFFTEIYSIKLRQYQIYDCLIKMFKFSTNDLENYYHNIIKFNILQAVEYNYFCDLKTNSITIDNKLFFLTVREMINY